MRFHSRALVMMIAIALWFCNGVLAQESFIESSSNKSFPKEVVFSYQGKEYKLVATGAAEFKRSVGKKSRSFYTIAHYMQNPPAVDPAIAPAQILKSTGPRQFILDFNMEVEELAFSEYMKRLLKKTADNAVMQQIKAGEKEFRNQVAKAFKKGERCTIRWLPDGKTLVSVSGKPDKIINEPALTPLFWQAWFGDDFSALHADLVRLLQSH